MNEEKSIKGRVKGIAKNVIAILFILLGVGLLLYWEVYGRDVVTYEERLVAQTEIKAGEVVNKKMITVAKFSKETVLENSFSSDEVDKLMGKRATQLIPKGQQLHSAYFEKAEEYIENNQSIFKIPAEWIKTRSSAIRKDDIISIYGEQGDLIGEFRVAFVKDEQEREVTDVGAANKTLERVEATGVINSIEIITTIDIFNQIKERAYDPDSDLGEKFIIVQKIDG